MQEKKIKEQEKREEKRQKENEIRESLKNQILSKISHEHQDEPESARKQRSFRIKRGSFLKTEKDPILRNQEPQNVHNLNKNTYKNDQKMVHSKANIENLVWKAKNQNF